MHRRSEDKGRSAQKFRGRAGKTDKRNTVQPLRGGIRL